MSCLFSFTFVLGVCIYEGRYLGRPKEAVRSPGSGIIELWVSLCVCWIKCGSSARAAYTFNCWAILPILWWLFLTVYFIDWKCLKSHKPHLVCLRMFSESINPGGKLLLHLGGSIWFARGPCEIAGERGNSQHDHTFALWLSYKLHSFDMPSPPHHNKLKTEQNWAFLPLSCLGLVCCHRDEEAKMVS